MFVGYVHCSRFISSVCIDPHLPSYKSSANVYNIKSVPNYLSF